MDKVRITIRRILLVLLVIWMVVVFGLSNQNGEESGNLSRAVANFLAGGDTIKAEQLEPLVRKVAHMTEYAIGGMLFYGITLTYPDGIRKKKIVLSLAFVILYAATDELHQLFINSRNGCVTDVIIDTVGGVLGIFSVYIVEATIKTMDRKVQENLSNQNR